jgi:hypothetical protein
VGQESFLLFFLNTLYSTGSIHCILVIIIIFSSARMPQWKSPIVSRGGMHHGMHSQTLFLKSIRLWVCYWIFSPQCWQVLRRLLRQFNKNIPLFSEITLLIQIFQIPLLFRCLHNFSDNTKTQLFYNFCYLEHCFCKGGWIS